MPPDSTFGASVDILGVPVLAADRAALTRALISALERGATGWFSSVNVYAMNLAHDLPWFRQFLRDSLFVYCDGEGVRLASRILGTPLPERIGLTFWVYDVLETLQNRGWSVFFLGSPPAILEKAVAKVRTVYPRLRIAGYHSGYFSEKEDQAIVDDINRAAPDLLLVGMGMPKQERWILDHRRMLQVPLITNAGSCFDSIAGNDVQIRALAGRVGMEWFYRFLREPRRLWKRYLLGNPLFLGRVLRARWQRGKTASNLPKTP